MAWLLVRPHDEDVVLPGEKILYKERRHWAAMTPELFQFLAVVFLQSAFAMRGTTGMGTVLLFGSVLAVIILRPLVKRDGWDTWQLLVAAGVGFWAIQSGVGVMELANLLVLVMGARLAVRAIRWAFYQQTYLTNRRLMEVDGFLGIRVNSMPLSKVTDIMLRRNPVGDLLGYGTFRVETAGQDQALGRLDYLRYPEEFHDLVVAGPKFG